MARPGGGVRLERAARGPPLRVVRATADLSLRRFRLRLGMGLRLPARGYLSPRLRTREAVGMQREKFRFRLASGVTAHAIHNFKYIHPQDRISTTRRSRASSFKGRDLHEIRGNMRKGQNKKDREAVESAQVVRIEPELDRGCGQRGSTTPNCGAATLQLILNLKGAYTVSWCIQ